MLTSLPCERVLAEKIWPWSGESVLTA